MSVHDAEADLVKLAEADLAELGKRVNEIEAELAAVRAPLEAELTKVHAEMLKIKNFLEMRRRYVERNANRGAVQVHPVESGGAADRSTISINSLPMSDDILAQACRGKSIADAAIALIQVAGHPLSEEELVDGLGRAGVIFVSDNPVLNVHFYLIKKRKETGAVKRTTDKRWAIDEVHGRSGAVHNRDKVEHVEKTRRGLLAARERGAKGGRRSKMTPEMKETAERMIAEGARQTEIAKQIGVTPITLQRWREKGLVSDRRTISNDSLPSGLGVSLMITQEQKDNLRKRGYTDEQIHDMKPQDAHRALGLIN